MIEQTKLTELAVRLEGITKRFPGVVANDNISFEVQAGEIHALLGENGAGKSTLMSILAGLYRPDQGQIIIQGKPVTFRNPADAIAAGIGMVWQHFKLVPTQTVTENIALGLQQPRFRLGLSQIEQKLRELSTQYGLLVRPDAKISELSVGEQQRVEIIKALYYGARILILDEPTANLTPQEASNLFEVMRNLVAQNYAIVFISHKLAEIEAVANRATILRRGKTVATVAIEGGEAERRHLAHLMIGTATTTNSDEALLSLAAEVAPAQNTTVGAKILLEAQKLVVKNDQGLIALKQLSLQVHEGQIVALVGVAGNGQRELAEALAGLRKIEAGTLWLNAQDVTKAGPRQLAKLGLAFVPEDRLQTGAAAGLNLEQNYILKSYWQPTLRRGPFLRRKVARQQLAQAIRQYDVRVGSVEAPVRLLSGGNLQKLLLAREIGSNPQALIVANPTRGLDIGATEYVRSRMLEQRQQGTAILLITEDLDEALALGDRLVVIYDGTITGEISGSLARTSLEQIGLWMTGG
jgi:simple sugar transport system ATP-binding protein